MHVVMQWRLVLLQHVLCELVVGIQVYDDDDKCSKLVHGLVPHFFLHKVKYHGWVSLCLQYYIYLSARVYSWL